MPEIVCTIEVNAAMGITYRAVSIAFFSASRSIPFKRSALTRGVTYLSSFRMAKASSFSRAESSAYTSHAESTARSYTSSASPEIGGTKARGSFSLTYRWLDCSEL